MAEATSRGEFIDLIRRRLGEPLIQLNVSAEQVEDRVDFALRKFATFHYDGVEKTYFKKQVTAADIANGWFTLPENVVGIVDIFPLNGTLLGDGGLFSAQYQFVLNNIWSWQMGSLVPYYMAMQHLALIEQVLVGQKPVRYNQYKNRLSIDMDWSARVSEGSYILVECWVVVDPDEWDKIWSDTWLTRYATQQVKQQWGENLKKYQGVQLPGNVVFNGQVIWDEATAALEQLEVELRSTYEWPVSMFVG